jgi:hypothetical protein
VRKLMGRACFIVLTLAMTALSGCPGKAADSGGTAASNAPGVTGAAAVAPKPGCIVGRITRPDGSAIGIAGAKLAVHVNGVAGMGNDVEYMPPVDDSGNFSLPVASGIYHQASASIALPFSGKWYGYQLVPTTMLGDTQSDKGIVANFVWQISGPLWTVKDNPDPTNFTHWFGGCCTLQWDEYYKDAQGALKPFNVPVGAKFDFTATPQGKLIDGSNGKPRTWECKWVELGLTPTVLNDMPATSGGWKITGQEIDPDGKSFPILFESKWNLTYGPEADVQFDPDKSAAPGFWPPPLMITRPAP